MGPHSHDVRRMILPLRLIFWGFLFLLVDFRIPVETPGARWEFDLLSDFVGMAMLTWATFRLTRFSVDRRSHHALWFVNAVALLQCAAMLRTEFLPDVPLFLNVLDCVFGFAIWPAILLFCLSMRWVCEYHGYTRAIRSWRLTTWLFVIIYVVPMGLLSLTMLIMVLVRGSFSYLVSSMDVLLVVFAVCFVPLVHLFISTSRMKRAVGRAVRPAALMTAFPVVPLQGPSVSAGEDESEARTNDEAVLPQVRQAGLYR